MYSGVTSNCLASSYFFSNSAGEICSAPLVFAVSRLRCERSLCDGRNQDRGARKYRGIASKLLRSRSMAVLHDGSSFPAMITAGG